MDEEYFYFVRKLKPYWGSRRYEYIMHSTLGRARAAAKNAIKQGGQFLEPQMIIRVPAPLWKRLRKLRELQTG